MNKLRKQNQRPAPQSKALAYQPFNAFFYRYATAGKMTFMALTVLLVLAGVFLVHNLYNPEYWSIQVLDAAEVEQTEVVVEQVRGNYREMPQLANAFRSFITFAAEPVIPRDGLLWLMAFFLAAGWSALMAASSRIKGFWAYIIFFLLGSFLYLSEPGRTFMPTAPVIGDYGVPLVFLIVGYLFQSEILFWRVERLFVFWLVVFSAYFGLTYFAGGLPGLHRATSLGVFPLGVLLTLFVLITSKDFIWLVLLAGTNRPKRERRWPGLLVILLCAVWPLLFGAMALAYHDVIPASFGPLSPVLLLILGALVTIYTSQNAYHQISDIIVSNLAYNLMLGGAGLLSLALLGGAYGAMEQSFVFQMNKLIITIYALVAVFQWIYLFFNFYPKLRAKENVFRYSMFPLLFRFEAVWFAAVAMLLLIESFGSFASFNRLIGLMKNANADNYLFRGDAQSAIAQYAQSARYLPFDPKANYNLATLKYRKAINDDNPESAGKDLALSREIQERYEAADRFGSFPYATLNLGSFLYLSGNAANVKNVYVKEWEKRKDPRILNNLAYAYYQEQQPDSAIICLKAALEQQPSAGQMLANLSLIYHLYEKPTEAEEFIHLAMEANPDHPLVRQNYYYLRLAQPFGSKKTYDLEPRPEAGAPRTEINKALYAIKAGKYESAREIARLLREAGDAEGAEAEAGYLQMLAYASQDSARAALDQYKTLAHDYPQYAELAGHGVAAYYMSRGAPDMAAHYFRAAAEAGNAYELLNVGYMLADAGRYAAAYDTILSFRAKFPDLAPLADRELTILDYAAGNTEPYLMRWDMQDISYLESMRLTRYAWNMDGNLNTGIRFLDKWVQEDTSLTEPFVLIARLLRDSELEEDKALAVNQLDEALRKKPGDPLLLAEQGLNFLAWNKIKQAAEFRDKALQAEADHPRARYLKALLAIRQKDWKTAAETLKQLSAEQPLASEYYPPMTRALLQLGESDAAYDLTAAALELNDRNAELWASFARAAARKNITEAVEEAYGRAAELAVQPERAARYRQEGARVVAKLMEKFAPDPEMETDEDWDF